MQKKNTKTKVTYVVRYRSDDGQQSEWLAVYMLKKGTHVFASVAYILH